MKKATLLIIIVLAALALIGGSASIVIYSLTHPNLKPPGKPAVTIAAAKQQQWQEHITEPGVLTAYQGISIKAEAAGRVTGIYFHSGEKVKTGQMLVQLDQSVQKGQLDNYKSQMMLDKLTYERNKKLYTTKTISGDAYDQALYAYKSSVAQVEQAQGELDHTVIVAPFSGKLGLTNIAIGDYLSVGQQIVNLQHLDPMYVDFQLPQKYLAKLGKHAAVEVVSTTYPNQIFAGNVIATESVINNNTGSLTVRASIPNKSYKLLPGNFVEVTVYLGEKQSIITVPQTAVVYSTSGDYVYKLVNGKAVKTSIKIGEQVKQDLEVTEGLAVGDQVIVDGTEKIHNGSAVKVINENKK